MRRGITEYSKSIPGSPKNYHWDTRFDVTDGVLGITQSKDEETDRVLLTSRQVSELLKFCAKHWRKEA